MFAGSTWLLARLTARCFGARAGVLAALVLNATVYYGLMVGTFAEPDGPLLFFWLLTLDRLWVALGGAGGRTWAWLGVGLAWGGAMLSKYHAVLLPVGSRVVSAPAARGPPLPAATGALPGGGGGPRCVLAGDRLECRARLGLVPLSRGPAPAAYTGSIPRC